MRIGQQAVVAAAAVLMLAGCTTSTPGEAKPSAEPTPRDAALWDPCTMPADALSAIGLDPATASRDIAGVHQDGWKICGWSGSWYYIGIFSTEYTLDDVKNNPNNTAFQDVTVGPRRGVMYHEKYDATRREMCDIALGIAQGALLIRADKKGSKLQEEDTCAVVTRAAVALEPHLPH